ncbi:hypothetical protein M9H77_21652 [Catharanthus roseus]|uniref:Uncharacterized protein n=1 Tax=Catharanthus roseus TaxID=4058 RepID=A0ACC0AP14_CATRO|nr:hypothetical protein M9H77_21652 [Catharanthus roseus]
MEESWNSSREFCAPMDEITKIDKYIITIAIHLAKGTNIMLGLTILASIYRDLCSLKGIMPASTNMDFEDQGQEVLYLSYTLRAPFNLFNYGHRKGSYHFN